MPHSKLDTHQKALQINIDGARYGTFAEIGAGQEVVRWFFRVGGAAGTVAKSMSAYDMTVSDAIYGQSVRYVSRQRLLQMLDHEYELNLTRLKDSQKSLFAFANTVAAKSYSGRGEFHGWLGIRFQAKNGSAPSQILLHVRMTDRDALSQQEAIGILGVNLLYGAFYHSSDPLNLLKSLLDSLSNERILVDAAEFSGFLFENVDNRLMALHLVNLGLTEAAMFSPDGQILQPSEILRKRPILVERGNFRPVTLTHLDILKTSRAAFEEQLGADRLNLISLMEITTQNPRDNTPLESNDFLARADLLATIGQPVLVSRFGEYYKLISFLRRYTSAPIALGLGAGALKEIFDQRYYSNIEGGIMEALGRLFRPDVTAYIYPLATDNSGLLTLSRFKPENNVEGLYQHLLSQGCLKELATTDSNFGRIESREALRRIQTGDETWREIVPSSVAEMITDRKLFGYGSSLV